MGEGPANFEHGILATPNLGGGNDYAGWWGKKVWYVDDDNGVDGATGNTPTAALETIQRAIDLAGAGDVIYLRPRDISTGRYHEHGYYTGTLTIPAAKHGLSIIGTSTPKGSIGGNIQCMIEPASGETGATIQVNTPCANLENLGVKQINESLVGGINATSTFGTVQAWGLTVSNVFFKDFQAADSGLGSILIDTAHWTTIQYCIFREADMAILGRSTEASLIGLTIKDCIFMADAADVDCDIQVADCVKLLIDRCRFLHAKPTAGSRDIYINMNGTAGSGMASDCYFSHSSKTITDFITVAGEFLLVDCKGQNNDVIAT